MGKILWGTEFEEKATNSLRESLLKAMPDKFYVNDVCFVTHNHGDDRLFSACVSVEKDGGDMADFSVNVFPNGKSLIYCLDEEVFHPHDEEAIDEALKQGVIAWQNDEPYFKDMVIIKNKLDVLTPKKPNKTGIEI